MRLPEALELARRLRSKRSRIGFAGQFAVIVSFDGREATVRFHGLRAGQMWLSDNLEEYPEGIAVLGFDLKANAAAYWPMCGRLENAVAGIGIIS